jgi:6-phosphogluconolactonase
MNIRFIRLGLSLATICGLLFAGITGSAGSSPGTANESLVYFGTYTGAKSRGIYVSRFDSATGKLSVPELAAELKHPSFLAVAPSRRFLYAVGEANGLTEHRGGAVYAFRIEPTNGTLTLLNQEASGGAGPCHLSVDPTGRCLLVANYGSGSIAALPLLADGSLGRAAAFIQHHGASVNPARQTGPHAHFITPDPANRFALVCDLGLDQVLVYRLDPARAALSANEPAFATLKPGAGPRHLAFHPNGRWVYVIDELDSTITVCQWEPTRGALNAFQTIATLPEGFKGQNTCAEVQVYPSGRFLYGSNRGHDSLAVFSIHPETGKLSLVEHQSSGGRGPRHFALDPAGRWLLAENQSSDKVVVYRVDDRTGRLTATGESVMVGSPVCAVFVPSTSP